MNHGHTWVFAIPHSLHAAANPKRESMHTLTDEQASERARKKTTHTHQHTEMYERNLFTYLYATHSNIRNKLRMNGRRTRFKEQQL